MSKFWLIAREEIMVNLRQPSFYIAAGLMVVIFVAAGAFPRLQEAAAGSPLGDVETVLDDDESIKEPIGAVDLAGLVTEIPEEQDGLILYVDEAAAQTAVAAGEIDKYYLITADYLHTGNVKLVNSNPQLINDTNTGIQAVLRHNLLLRSDIPNLANRLNDPYTIDWGDQDPPPTFSFLPSDLPLSQLSTAGLVAGLFVYIINTSGFLLLGALQRESEARIMEVLITSSSAVQFVGGKIAGLSVLSFIQVGLSLGVGFLVYGGNPDGSGPAAIPLLVILVGIPYLLLGYFTFSSIMLSVVVLFPNLGESMQLQLFVRILFLSPIIGAIFILPNAQSSVSVFLTLFPISSPMLMPFRLLLGPVPTWQILTSTSLLLLWALLLFWFSTRLFRANTLLTGRTPTPRALWEALVG